ncbi:MAG: ribosomal L7Ae/L30e/S12e/Gadd45 family protein [Clostridia bacterium]|jgi:ribosomal protein L7Ae-like RNA K-turn-binding protein
MDEKIYTFIGLAQKAGRLFSGEELCERALKKNKVKVLIVTEDASDNTKKKFSDMCSYRSVELRYFGQKEILGRYIGKEIRAVVGISDIGFTKKLLELLESRGLQNGGAKIG